MLQHRDCFDFCRVTDSMPSSEEVEVCRVSPTTTARRFLPGHDPLCTLENLQDFLLMSKVYE